MISFVKELDKKTADFIQHLDKHHKRLTSMARLRIRLVVVWVDGDKRLLSKWAVDQGLQNVNLAVASSQDEKLMQWNLKTQSPHTVVLLKRRVALETYSEPAGPSAAKLEKRMVKVFNK